MCKNRVYFSLAMKWILGAAALMFCWGYYNEARRVGCSCGEAFKSLLFLPFALFSLGEMASDWVHGERWLRGNEHPTGIFRQGYKQ